MIDLELLYLQNNCNPKLFELIKDKFVEKECPKQANKSLSVGKYTSLDYFKLETAKDMVPIVYPSTMQVEPVIHELNSEHEEVKKLAQGSSLMNFAEHSVQYYEKKMKHEKEEFKRKKKKIQSQKDPSALNSNHLTETVLKRMQSDQLNSFMQQTEIQEITERYQEFQEMLKKEENQIRIKRNHRMSRTVPSQHVSTRPRKSSELDTLHQPSPAGSTKVSLSQRFQRPQSASRTTMTKKKTTTQNATLKPRARLLSSNTFTGTGRDKSLNLQISVNNLFNDDSESQRTSSLQIGSTIKPAANNVSIMQQQDSKRKVTARNKSTNWKSFTITVRHNRRDSSFNQTQTIDTTMNAKSNFLKKDLMNDKKPETARASDEQDTFNTILKDSQDVAELKKVKVYTDLIEAEQSGKLRIKKLFGQAKWQTEKNHLIESMAFHLERHRPVVKQSGTAYSISRTEVLSKKRQSQAMLQQRLSKQYGIKDTQEVELNKQCKTFLSEVPTLIAHKLRLDEAQSNEQKLARDVCKIAAVKQFQAKNHIPIENPKHMKVIQTKPLEQVAEVVEEKQKALSDPRPDVLAIAEQRIQQIKYSYIEKLENFQKEYKAKQAKLDHLDDVNSNSSAGVTEPAALRTLSFEPGIGSAATGSYLRDITRTILNKLDDIVQESSAMTSAEMELNMPELEWDAKKLNSRIKDMESVEFWQQKGLQCSAQSNIEAAKDYYKQGLRKNPASHTLIYLLAGCYCKQRKYLTAINWYNLGLSLNPRWIDGLCGVGITYFNMCDFSNALKYISLAKDNGKGFRIKESKLDYDVITLIRATCLKMTKNLDEASKAYVSLLDKFRRNNSRQTVSLMWGAILIALSNDRKQIAEHYHNLNEYLEHLIDVPTPAMLEQNLLLSKLCIGADSSEKLEHKTGNMLHYNYINQPPKLDWEKYPKSIQTLLNSKPFFKRYKTLKSQICQQQYDRILRCAQVELYGKDQVVFLNDRVGIVTAGAIEIRRHRNHDLMKPYVVKKAIEGDILGFAEGDKNYSASPLSWLVSMQDDSEVLFVSKSDWQELWNILRKFTEQQIVLQKLEQNIYFSKLNMITKYHLVYESLELKIFYPGQLIMSIHKRSPLCVEYQEFYKDGTSKFRREIDNRIVGKQNTYESKDTPTQYTNLLAVLNEGQESKQLRQMKKRLQMASPTNQISEIVSSSQKSTPAVSQRFPSCHGPGVVQKGQKGAKFENEQLGIKIQELDADSNSTEYGMEHAHQILTQKEMQQAQKKMVESVNETMQGIGSENYVPNVQQKKIRRNVSFEDPHTQNNKQVPLTKSAGSFSNNGSSQSKEIANVSFLDASLHSRSPRNLSVPERKKPALNRLTTEGLVSFSKHRIPRNLKGSIKYSNRANAQKVIAYDLNLQESVEKGLVNTNLHLLPALTPPTTAINTRIQIEEDLVTFMKKLKKDKKVGWSLRQNQFTSSAPKSRGDFAFLNGSQGQCFQSQPALLSGNMNQKFRSSSGVRNQLLIQTYQDKLKQLSILMNQDQDGQEALYKIAVNAINVIEQIRGQRQEPTGVHFIEAGEVLVVGEQMIPNARLNKCDAFGLSEILRKTGPEFLGDIRAGIRSVQTFYFSYEDLKKRLSIPEKIALKLTDHYQERFEAVINFIKQRDKIPAAKLSRF